MTETKSYKAYLIADGVRCHLLFGIAGAKRFHSRKKQEGWLSMPMRGKNAGIWHKLLTSV